MYTGKRLIMMSAKDKDDGKSKYDDVKVLEFGKIIDSHAFLPDMAKRIQKEIAQLEAMNKDFNEQLKKDPTKPKTEDEQRDMLLLVKNVIYTCKMEQPKIELQMDILLEALSYVQRMGVPTEKMDNEMKNCSENFGQVKKQLPIAAEIIKPVQEREGNKLKANIEKFTLASKVAMKDFRECEFNKYETGTQGAYENVMATKKKYLLLDKDLAELVGYATVFEFPETTVDAQTQMKELHTSLNSMLQLWHMTAMINMEIDVWSQTLWNDINVEQMEDGTKGFYKQLRALDKIAKSSNAYTELEKKVKGFLTALPLVTDLRSPSMRPRHWDMMRELTGKQFDETSPSFDLKTLNDLHLDEFEEDVGKQHTKNTPALKRTRTHLTLA
jgi:dynein heavy chain